MVHDTAHVEQVTEQLWSQIESAPPPGTVGAAGADGGLSIAGFSLPPAMIEALKAAGKQAFTMFVKAILASLG